MRFGPCLVISVLAFSCVSAKADSYTGTGSQTDNSQFTGSATLYTDTCADDGSCLINAIAPGDGYGAGITGLLDPGLFNNNDNLLYPGTAAVVDPDGFAFTATEGDTDFKVDVFSTGNGNYAAYLLDNDGFYESIPVTIDLTLVKEDPVFTIAFQGIPAAATPEPTSLALLGTGFLGVAGLVRRRRCRC